jgi:hypothetical protein
MVWPRSRIRKSGDRPDGTVEPDEEATRLPFPDAGRWTQEPMRRRERPRFRPSRCSDAQPENQLLGRPVTKAVARRFTMART